MGVARLAICLTAVLCCSATALNINNRGLLAAGSSAGAQVSQEVWRQGCVPQELHYHRPAILTRA